MAEKIESKDNAELGNKIMFLQGICFAFLYDICSWLANSSETVPDHIKSYKLGGVRNIVDPYERLNKYVDKNIVSSWKESLEPFFESGQRLVPLLDDIANIDIEGLQEGGPVTMVVRFTDKSSLLDANDKRLTYPKQAWVFTLYLRKDLEMIEQAILRQDRAT